MVKLTSVALCAIASVALSGQCYAQTAPAALPATVDEWLKREFSDVLSSCKIKLVQPFRTDAGGRVLNWDGSRRRDRDPMPEERTAEFVPAHISLDLARHLDQPVEYFSGQTLTSLYDKVWIINSGRYTDTGFGLNLNTSNIYDRIVVSGRSNIVYTHNCLTALRAAASADVNLDGVDIKAALEASFSAQDSVGTSFVYGTFRSPIAQGLGLATVPAGLSVDRTGDALHLWGWYRDYPRFVGQELHIVTEVHGIARYRFRDVSLQISGDASASAKTGFIVLNAGVSASTNVQATTTTTASSFDIIRWSTPSTRAVTYQPLPDVTTAAEAARGAGLRRTADPADLTLYDATPKTLSFEVLRMAESLCRAPWSSTVPEVTVLANRTRPDQGRLPACLFTVSIDGGALLARDSNAQQVPLEFGISTSFTAGGGTHTLVIDADPTMFANSSQFPYLRPASNTLAVTSDESGASVISGELEWLISQKDRLISRVYDPVVEVKCGDAAAIPLPVIGAPEVILRDGSNEQSRLRVRVSSTIPADLRGSQNCSFQMTARAGFTRAGSGQVLADGPIRPQEDRKLLVFPSAPTLVRSGE